jgi:uncharacterized protein involved in exopolysaccharide biosynthesis
MIVSESNPPDQTETPVDLRAIGGAIWRRKIWVFLFLVLSQAVYLAFHLTAPRLYATQTKFIFKDSQGSMGSLGGLADLVGLQRQSKTNLSDYFAEVVYSYAFLAKIEARKWKIGNDSLFLHEYWKLEPYKDVPDAELRTFRKRVGKLRGPIRSFGSERYLQIEKDKRTNLVVLETRFQDGRLSYDLNHFVLELLNDHLLNHTKSQAGENRRFIQTRLEEVSGDLRKSEDALLAFQMRNQSMTSPPILLELTRLRRNLEINQQIYLELKKQLEMARIEELKESPVIEIIAPPDLPLMPDRRFNLKAWAVITWLGIMIGAVAALVAANRGRGKA